MRLLVLDCETTGLPPKGADWREDFEQYPHVVQLAWLSQDWTGNDWTGRKERSYIIRPEGWEVPEESVKIHGISQGRAFMEGYFFWEVINEFVKDCADAYLIIGHNIYFDVSIIKANILREMGQRYYDTFDCESSLHKGKRIDTMRSAMKWCDARTQDGRLKFPSLAELYSRCFKGESFPAHNALEDVRALARCLPILIENGILELKQKEYPAEQLEIPFKTAENTPVLGESNSDNKVIVTEKIVENTGDFIKNREMIFRNKETGVRLYAFPMFVNEGGDAYFLKQANISLPKKDWEVLQDDNREKVQEFSETDKSSSGSC